MSSAFEQLRTVLIATALILLPNQAQPATYLPNRVLKPPCILPSVRMSAFTSQSRFTQSHSQDTKQKRASLRQKKKRTVFALG